MAVFILIGQKNKEGYVKHQPFPEHNTMNIVVMSFWVTVQVTWL